MIPNHKDSDKGKMDKRQKIRVVAVLAVASCIYPIVTDIS